MMRAVIIAAGFGSRLSQISDSKPLTKVRGVPLIEWSIRQARSSGIEQFTVVTGHQAKRLEQELALIATRIGIDIDTVRVSDWSKPNGYSVMAGAAAGNTPFLLMMGDHIFASDILERLVKEPLNDCGVVLAVDRRLSHALIDPEDATWVETDKGASIRAIGKHIKFYDAVDCGAFLASGELADAIAEAIASGAPGSLSDGMQRLADKGRARTMDIGESWWIDVDDPRSLAQAEAQMPAQIDRAFAGAQVENVKAQAG